MHSLFERTGSLSGGGALDIRCPATCAVEDFRQIGLGRPEKAVTGQLPDNLDELGLNRFPLWILTIKQAQVVFDIHAQGRLSG